MPLLGINLGKVGFLSKAEADELEAVLAQLVAGAVHDRRADGARGADPARPAARAPATDFIALNDIVVARGSLARVVRLDVAIDGSRTSRRSSPTGSSWPARPARPATRSRPAARSSTRVSRNLVVTPIAGYLSAIRSVVVSPRQVVRCAGRRRARGAGLDRRSRGPPDRGRRRRRGPRPGAADPVRGAAGAAAVLGPAPAQGGAAAVVTDARRERGRAGRLLELTVTDLALIDRLRLELGAGSQRHHRRDRRRQEPADRCPGPGARRAGGHDAGPARGGDRAGRGAVRPAARSRSSRSAR